MDDVRLAGEHDEHRLERVLGEVVVAERPPAHAEHRRPVPPHELGERCSAPGVHEPLHQRRVRLGRCGEPADEPHERGCGHAGSSAGRATNYLTAGPRRVAQNARRAGGYEAERP
jgi:hypothetical protein